MTPVLPWREGVKLLAKLLPTIRRESCRVNKGFVERSGFRKSPQPGQGTGHGPADVEMIGELLVGRLEKGQGLGSERESCTLVAGQNLSSAPYLFWALMMYSLLFSLTKEWKESPLR